MKVSDIKNMKIKCFQNISIQVKAALIFTIATFICKGINFITLPIFTRILTTEEMGIVATYNSWYILLVVFANLSLDSGSFNIAMMEYEEERYKYMSSILVLSTISSGIIIFLFLIFKPFILSFMGIDEPLMWLMNCSFIFLPATSFWMLHQRYIYKYKSTAVVTFCSTGLSVIISAIVTFIASQKGVRNLADVRLISSNFIFIAWGLFFYILILVKGKTGFNKEYWRFVLKVNTPLMFHSLAKHILDVSDRTMISNIVGKSQVGIYGVLYSVSALMLIIWSAINTSLIPYMFEKMKEKKYKDISSFVETMLLIYSIVCIGLTLIAPELVKILATEEYFEAIYLMPPIAAGIFFTSLYNIYSNLLLFYKKTNAIMYATAVSAIFNIASNYIFIKNIGYQSAAYTTLASYILLAFMQFLQLHNIEGFKPVFNDKKLWIIAGATCIFCVSINILYKSNYMRYGLILILIILLFIFHKRIIKTIKKMRRKDV